MMMMMMMMMIETRGYEFYELNASWVLAFREFRWWEAWSLVRAWLSQDGICSVWFRFIYEDGSSDWSGHSQGFGMFS